MLSKKELKALAVKAKECEKNALAFKSKHSIGASVSMKGGEILGGCNIDGVISSQGICAEMVAVNNAVSSGLYHLKAVLVYDQNEFLYPCGACLQYLSQFSQISGDDIEIILANDSGKYKKTKLSNLLPKRYVSKSFAKKLKKYNK